MAVIKIPKFEITDEDPFQGDYFGQKALVESLCKLALEVDEPLVLGLTAPWGHGKSTIVDRVEKQISSTLSKEIGFIKYDAFRNDFVSDIFISITSQLINYLNEAQQNGESNKNATKEKKKIIEAGKEVAKVVTKNALFRSIDGITGGLIDTEKIIEKLEKGSGIDVLIDERLVRASEDQLIIENFTSTLSEAIEASGKTKLVFVIDELDRCRPDFAIEILEKVKHFFACNNVLFIIVYNKSQLENSISHIYGVSQTSTYLQRFIDLECSVAISGPNVLSENQLLEFTRFILGQHELDGNWVENASYTINELYKLLGEDISLRTIKKICAQIAAYSLSSSRELPYDKHIVSVVATLFICRRKYFDSIYERASQIAADRSGIEQIDMQLVKERYPLLYEFLTTLEDDRIDEYGHLHGYLKYYLYIDSNLAENLRTNYRTQRHWYLASICNLISRFHLEG